MTLPCGIKGVVLPGLSQGPGRHDTRPAQSVAEHITGLPV